MIEVKRTVEFAEWLKALKDREARSRILRRLQRLEGGNFGDVKHFHAVLVILLYGGDKRRQSQDIEHARQLAKEIE